MTGEWSELLLRFFDRGGPALWAILAVSMWLWVRIGEGYLFVYVTHPREAAAERVPAPEAALRLALRLSRRVEAMRALVAVLPLLGLLGTVGGMIEAFDVLAYSGGTSGSTSPRGLSLGISQALLTTMAGLVTSLAGLFASTPLARRAAAAARDAAGGEAGRDGFAVSPLLLLRTRLLGRAPRMEVEL